jgi:hypothetical protein
LWGERFHRKDPAGRFRRKVFSVDEVLELTNRLRGERAGATS